MSRKKGKWLMEYDKELDFAREYCIDFNLQAACDRLGITTKQGSVYLRRNSVKSMIAERKQELISSDVINVGFVLAALRENTLVAMGKVPLRTLSGEDMGYQDYNPNAVNKSLELLGKAVGMWSEDNKTSVNVNIASALVSQWEERENGDTGGCSEDIVDMPE